MEIWTNIAAWCNQYLFTIQLTDILDIVIIAYLVYPAAGPGPQHKLGADLQGRPVCSDRAGDCPTTLNSKAVLHFEYVDGMGRSGPDHPLPAPRSAASWSRLAAAVFFF